MNTANLSHRLAAIEAEQREQRYRQDQLAAGLVSLQQQIIELADLSASKINENKAAIAKLCACMSKMIDRRDRDQNALERSLKVLQDATATAKQAIDARRSFRIDGEN